MKPAIGIPESNSQFVANELVKLLADEYVLYTKTRNAHWNIEGADFLAKHKLFEAQASELDAIIDNVAERIRTIGHFAYATLRSFLESTHLMEVKGDKNDSQTYILELLADHESIIIHCRANVQRFAADYHDFGTSDFITGLMQTHEKMAWILRAHITA